MCDGWFVRRLEPGDATGRQFVPGRLPYSAMMAQSKLPISEDLHQPTVPMLSVTWEKFQDFIICGQIYE